MEVSGLTSEEELSAIANGNSAALSAILMDVVELSVMLTPSSGEVLATRWEKTISALHGSSTPDAFMTKVSEVMAAVLQENVLRVRAAAERGFQLANDPE